jgi:hypothetical protein
MIDQLEEENLKEYQEQAYLFRVSFVLKAWLGNGPSKRVKWQGKVGEDWVTSSFDIACLDLQLGQAMEWCNFQDDLEEIVVSIKFDASKATRKTIYMADLS